MALDKIEQEIYLQYKDELEQDLLDKFSDIKEVGETLSLPPTVRANVIYAVHFNYARSLFLNLTQRLSSPTAELQSMCNDASVALYNDRIKNCLGSSSDE